MSDESRRKREREEADGPLFDADPSKDPTGNPERPDDSLSFGDDDSASLPHWTEPPTGEIPRLRSPGEDPDISDDLDVWSSFTSESPVWRDDTVVEAASDPSGPVEFDSTDPMNPQHRRVEFDPAPAPPREPSRITIGTDPSGMSRSPSGGRPRRQGGGSGRSGSPSRPTRPGRPAGPPRTAPPPGRDMPIAIAVGVVMAVLFIAATLWRPAAVLAIAVVVLGLAAWEFFGRVTDKGYRPAVAAGLLGCIAAPLAAYWLGPSTIPLVVTLAFMAGAIGFIGAPGVESGPLPNMAISMLGLVWIGVLGSYAALILRLSNEPFANSIGTDTLFLLALGIVANDVGALFIGSAAGRTPLREWISPGKTVEGLVGGSLFTILALVVVGITDRSTTWNSLGDLLLLALVICVMAPLGDLVESMFKRNLDVKDFGSLVRGHGGLLDRFDAFLFCLPAVYYLTLVLEPWVS